MRESFAKLLKLLRTERGMSQRQLASKVGVHYTYISKLEAGKENPSQTTVRSLAAALDTNTTELELAAGYLPREFLKAIATRDELQRLLGLASIGRLSEDFYKRLRELLEREDVVSVPVWLE